MIGELLYPLSSLRVYVTENLEVYPMINGKPDISRYSHVSNFASKWVSKISNEDDTILSKLIKWKESNE